MKIPYDLIIENANHRKDALQRLEVLLDDLPGHLLALDGARTYAKRLLSQAQTLDKEARDFVGEPGMRAIYKFEAGVSGVYTHYLDLLDTNPGLFDQGNGKSNLQNLRALAEE